MKPTPMMDIETVQDAFEQTTGKVLLARDAKELFIDRDPNIVTKALNRWLSEGYGDWMNNPVVFLKRDFADYYRSASKVNLIGSEWTPEQDAAMRAKINEQIERDRAEIETRMASRAQEEANAANFDPFA